MTASTPAPFPMKVFALANEKGGVGKTTLAAQLGVNLDIRGYYTVVIDVDHHRGGIKRWWERRQSDYPELLKINFDQMRATLDQLRQLGVECVVIDTPGWKHEKLVELFQIADLVVVPCQPSPLDLEGTADTFSTLKEHSAKSVFVLNTVEKRERLSAESMLELSRNGKVAGIVHKATAMKACMGWGESLDEFEPSHPVVKEVDELTTYLLQEVGVSEPRPVPPELRQFKEPVKRKGTGKEVQGKKMKGVEDVGKRKGTKGSPDPSTPALKLVGNS